MIERFPRCQPYRWENLVPRTSPLSPGLGPRSQGRGLGNEVGR